MTLFLGRFASPFLSTTLPGESPLCRFDVSAHMTTVLILLELNKLFWITIWGCLSPGAEPRGSRSLTRVFGRNLADTAAKLNLKKTVADSGVLGRNMEKLWDVVKQGGTAAHHIVAGKGGGPSSDQARAVLDKLGINLINRGRSPIYRCFINRLQIFDFPYICHPSYRTSDFIPYQL